VSWDNSTKIEAVGKTGEKRVEKKSSKKVSKNAVNSHSPPDAEWTDIVEEPKRYFKGCGTRNKWGNLQELQSKCGIFENGVLVDACPKGWEAVKEVVPEELLKSANLDCTMWVAGCGRRSVSGDWVEFEVPMKEGRFFSNGCVVPPCRDGWVKVRDAVPMRLVKGTKCTQNFLPIEL
jgi:hypothetical protein